MRSCWFDPQNRCPFGILGLTATASWGQVLRAARQHRRALRRRTHRGVDPTLEDILKWAVGECRRLLSETSDVLENPEWETDFGYMLCEC